MAGDVTGGESDVRLALIANGDVGTTSDTQQCRVDQRRRVSLYKSRFVNVFAFGKAVGEGFVRLMAGSAGTLVICRQHRIEKQATTQFYFGGSEVFVWKISIKIGRSLFSL